MNGDLTIPEADVVILATGLRGDFTLYEDLQTPRGIWGAVDSARREPLFGSKDANVEAVNKSNCTYDVRFKDGSRKFGVDPGRIRSDDGTALDPSQITRGKLVKVKVNPSASAFIDNTNFTQVFAGRTRAGPMQGTEGLDLTLPIKCIKGNDLSNAHGTHAPLGIFFVGPRGGEFYNVDDLEAFGQDFQRVVKEIQENTVSIFLLAPPTAQTAVVIDESLKKHYRMNPPKDGIRPSQKWADLLQAGSARLRVNFGGGLGAAAALAAGAPRPRSRIDLPGRASSFVCKETRFLGTLALEWVGARLLLVLWKHFRFSSGFELRIIANPQSARETLCMDVYPPVDETGMQSVKHIFREREGLLLAVTRDLLLETALERAQAQRGAQGGRGAAAKSFLDAAVLTGAVGGARARDVRFTGRRHLKVTCVVGDDGIVKINESSFSTA